MPGLTPMRDFIMRHSPSPGRPILSLSAAFALSVSLSGFAFGQDGATTEQTIRPAGSFAGAILAARTAERDADYDVAIRFLREAIGYSDEGDLNLEQALLRAQLLGGAFDDAVETAQLLEDGGNVSADPQNVILLTLVVDALRTREYNRAIQYLDVEGVNDLDNLLFSGLLSWVHAGLDQEEEAFATLDGSASGPEWVRLYVDYNRGMLAEQFDRVDEAREHYTNAISNEALGGQLRETYARAAAALASLEAREGNREAAVAALDQAERVVGGDALLDYLREAIDAERPVPPHVTGVADGASELLHGLGMALTGSRAGDLARNYLQFARALAPDAAAPLIGLAQVEEQADRPALAIELYDEVREDSPLSSIAMLQRGLNLADMDRLDEARAELRSVYDERPDDLRVVIALGNTLAMAEAWDEASELYDEVLAGIDEVETIHWLLFYRRGIAHERLDEWPSAEADFQRALELQPDHPAVLNYLGYSWIDMNMNLDEGLEMIRKAVSIQPNSGAFVDSLGWAYYRLGRFEEAVTELERALTLETSDPVIHDHLGDAYWRVGREREARFQWGHALKMDLEPEDRRRIRAKLTNGLEPVAENGDAADADDDRA